jgi:hypothetical protein
MKPILLKIVNDLEAIARNVGALEQTTGVPPARLDFARELAAKEIRQHFAELRSQIEAVAVSQNGQ